jgi:hypothetical protein
MNIFGDYDDLVIDMEGPEKFWAMKSKLRIPRSDIESIAYDPTKPPKKILALPFIKFPGSVIPGLMFAGTFVKRGERDFWYILMRHDGVLSIQTKKGSFNYDRIMISCGAETAQSVDEWWKETKR